VKDAKANLNEIEPKKKVEVKTVSKPVSTLKPKVD
jgi:hypothetical protein